MLKWLTSKSTAIDPTIDFRIETLMPFHPKGFVEGAWWMAALELRNASIEELIQTARSKGYGLRVPFFYDDATRKRRAERNYVSVYARSDLIAEANRRDNDLSVARMVLGSIVPEGEVFGQVPVDSNNPVQVSDKTVIVGVIDTGIAFAHDLFRLSDNRTRVHCAWIMDADNQGAGTQGRVLGENEINGLLQNNTRSGLLDEDAFYREAGLIDFRQPGFKPASLRTSHGTHVMGLAAGFPPAEDNGTRPIICVQLPTYAVMDVTGDRIREALPLAIDFIFACASGFEVKDKPGQRPPVVINFSFGNFSGPHDGTGVIEQIIDDRLGPPAPATPDEPPPDPRRRMTLPAGNHNLSRCHAEIVFPNDEGEAVLDWRVLPDDRSESFVQLWMPWRPPGQGEGLVEVRVTPPGGPESSPVGASYGDQTDLLLPGGVKVGQVTFAEHSSLTGRGVVDICILPTFSLDPGIPLAPAGLWQIRVTPANFPAGKAVQVWIKRDDTLPGFPLYGRQSYFDNACYVRFDKRGAPLAVDPPGDDCIVRRSRTLSGFACGKEPPVIAGYVRKGREMADYSAAGPITVTPSTPDPNRTGPDAAARSDDSAVAHGVLSAGSRSGSLVPMNGTSVSAPQVAFWIAEELAAGRPGNRTAVWNKGLADDPNNNPDKPEETRVGGGRMKLAVRLGSKRPGPDVS